jgi:hypothetical protein
LKEDLMLVKFVRERSFVSAGPDGPSQRVFEIGEVVDLPEMHARMEMMQGAAVREGEEDPGPDPSDHVPVNDPVAGDPDAPPVAGALDAPPALPPPPLPPVTEKQSRRRKA